MILPNIRSGVNIGPRDISRSPVSFPRAACAAHSTLPSHVMTAMGRTADEARAGLRFSFSLATRETEAAAAAEIVLACLRGRE